MLPLARQGLQVLFVRGGAAASAFCLTYAVARTLGVDGAGIYYLALSVGTILAVLGRAGLDVALLRFLAEAMDSDDRPAARHLYGRGLLASIAWSSTLTIAVWLVAPQLSELFAAGARASGAIRAASLLIPIQAAAQVHLQVLNALQRPVLASSATLMLPPLTAGAVIWLWSDLEPLEAILVTAASGTLGVLAAAITVRRVLPLPPKPSQQSLRDLLRTAAPLMVAGSAAIVMQWTDIVVLGVFQGPGNVGLYAPAARTASLISLILFALNSVVSPRFATLHKRKESAAFERLARQSSAVGTAIAVPVAGAILIWAPVLMNVFGAAFEEGATALRILAFGHLVNVATGSVGYALSMSGLQALLQRSAILAAVGNLALNLALVPVLGIEGAAIATSVSLVGMNALNLWWVFSELQVQPLPFLAPVTNRSSGEK